MFPQQNIWYISWHTRHQNCFIPALLTAKMKKCIFSLASLFYSLWLMPGMILMTFVLFYVLFMAVNPFVIQGTFHATLPKHFFQSFQLGSRLNPANFCENGTLAENCFGCLLEVPNCSKYVPIWNILLLLLSFCYET